VFRYHRFPSVQCAIRFDSRCYRSYKIMTRVHTTFSLVLPRGLGYVVDRSVQPAEIDRIEFRQNRSEINRTIAVFICALQHIDSKGPDHTCSWSISNRINPLSPYPRRRPSVLRPARLPLYAASRPQTCWQECLLHPARSALRRYLSSSLVTVVLLG
jgi:hypothetical protein